MGSWSFFLGQYVGISHLMEEVLQEERGAKTFSETNLGKTSKEPLVMFGVFQKKIEIMSKKIEIMGKLNLLSEEERIRTELQKEGVGTLNFKTFDFMNGYHQQLAWGKIVIRRNRCI